MMGEYKKEDSYNYYQLFHLDEYMYGHHGFIAGGCFKNIFNGEKPKDIDIWFENKTDFYNAKIHFEELIEEIDHKFIEEFAHQLVTNLLYGYPVRFNYHRLPAEFNYNRLMEGLNDIR